MGLYDTIELKRDLPPTFENDGFELTDKIIEKYRYSKMNIDNGQVLPSKTKFCKNTSIFDLTGTKIFWGDLAPEDVKSMMGVYYILSEFTSYWSVKEDAVRLKDKNQRDPNSKSMYRHLLPQHDAVALDLNYIKRNAFARIVDGELQTSEELIRNHHATIF